MIAWRMLPGQPSPEEPRMTVENTAGGPVDGPAPAPTRPPATPQRGVAAALERVREAPFLLDALRAAQLLDQAAAADRSADAVPVLEAALADRDDDVTAIAAVHALSRVVDDRADAVLSELLSCDRVFLREHAAWALERRLPRLDAIGRLVGAVTAGGFTGVLAQHTLERWARSAPDHVALAVEGALAAGHDRAVRARLVETLGLVPGPVAARAVLRFAGDEGEEREGRLAAVAALGDRGARRRAGRCPSRTPAGAGEDAALDAAAEALVGALAAGDGDLAATARLAAIDLGLLVPAPVPAREGLTVAQLFLHADLDRSLSRAGAGDTGGVATLLVRLGDALAEHPCVARVLTLSRGSAERAAQALTAADPVGEAHHQLVPVPLLEESAAMAAAWPAQRGLRRALSVLGPVDVLHLRMADVGSMVAAEVAAELGVPTVFTLAPDPHGVIHSLDMTGALTRRDFGAADEREHYWFRTSLVARLAASSAHRVLFPRPRLAEELRELLGVDVTGPRAAGATVVPEGIDLSVVREAAGAHAAGRRARVDGLDDLEELVAALPAHRRGLPVLLTAGRLHRVKGVATVVQAWAQDAGLRARCNLVVVGGDLADPSTEERDQLDRIAAALADADRGAADGSRAADGLVLAGHRPHAVVARWMAAARAGTQPGPDGVRLVAPQGAYVCGSLKEEFGLALVEALAAGLVVVAPAGGGPATFVDDGATGVLVDTRDPRDVARGTAAALDLAAAPDRPAHEAAAVALVADRFTVQAMATALTGVYAGVVGAVRA